MQNKLILGSMLAVLAVATGCARDDSGRLDPIAQTEQELQVTVHKSKWRGGNASAYSSTEAGYQNFYAWENTEGNNRTAYLEFYSYEYDLDSLVCETEIVCWDDGTGGSATGGGTSGPPSGGSDGTGTGGSSGGEICEEYEYCYYADYIYRSGYGQIPSSAFKVGKKTASLEVTLEDIENFESSECSTTTPECVPVTGDISLSFSANGNYFSSNNGTSRTTYRFDGYAYSSRSTGQSSSRSANVTGSAFGEPLVDAQGDIGESKGSGVSKEIIKE